MAIKRIIVSNVRILVRKTVQQGIHEVIITNMPLQVRTDS